jgi:hypothetical protein
MEIPLRSAMPSTEKRTTIFPMLSIAGRWLVAK